MQKFNLKAYKLVVLLGIILGTLVVYHSHIGNEIYKLSQSNESVEVEQVATNSPAIAGINRELGDILHNLNEGSSVEAEATNVTTVSAANMEDVDLTKIDMQDLNENLDRLDEYLEEQKEIQAEEEKQALREKYNIPDYELKEYKSPKTKYTQTTLNVRTLPDASDDSTISTSLNVNTEVTIIGKVKGTDWCYYEDGEELLFVHSEYLGDEEVEIKQVEQETYNYSWNGAKLTPGAGTIMGPSGKETYYNLDMSTCIRYMRNLGNTDEYWVRSDGAKMLGPYVMCAAAFSIRPRGTLVETSLGTGIVVDTGTFAYTNEYQLDLCTVW